LKVGLDLGDDTTTFRGHP